MKKVALPANEHERLMAISEYDVLHTMPAAGFDDITRMAAIICNMPVSLINIIDEHTQHIRSHYGLDATEIKREYSFCTHALETPGDILIIPDLRKDARFSDHPFVTGNPHFVFYAGIPLVTPDGYALGALCVMDYKSGALSADQLANLRALSRQVINMLELAKNARQLKHAKTELTGLYADLEKLSHIASHDLKSPLNNIISLTHLLLQEYATKLDDEGNEYIGFLNDAAYRLSDLVSGVMSYARIAQLTVDNKECIRFTALVEETIASLNIVETVTIIFEKNDRSINTSRIALKQILTQLILNAIKYNDKIQSIVELQLIEKDTHYIIEVKDNGPGISAEDQERIFFLFERLTGKIKDGENMGMGLTIAKRLAEKLEGDIKVFSEEGKGASFILSIPK